MVHIDILPQQVVAVAEGRRGGALRRAPLNAWQLGMKQGQRDRETRRSVIKWENLSVTDFLEVDVSASQLL